GAAGVSGDGPRALVVALGLALAVAIVIAPAGVLDAARRTLDTATDLERADAQVAFAAPVDDRELGELRAVPGVALAEPAPSGTVVIAGRRSRYLTDLEAFERDTELQRFTGPDGASITLPRRGVLLAASLAELLDVDVGDRVSLTIVGSGLPAASTTVAALTGDTLGNLVFTSNGGLRAALGTGATSFAGGLFNTAALGAEPGADLDAVARRVTRLSDVEVYVPVGADLAGAARARPLLSVTTVALLVIGVVVAALTALLVGFTVSEGHVTPGWSWPALVRTAVPVAVGLVLGALVGTALAGRLVDALESDLVHLEAGIDPLTYLAAIGLPLVVIAVVALVGAGRGHETDPETSATYDGPP
ncbi:MAG TPA: hypothetical protein VF152_15365, partial [Acidimicrobiia bacterium]